MRRDREDGFQDTTPGEFDSEELVSRGPDSFSLPSNVPISGLTGHVTADRIQSHPVSSMTSPECKPLYSRVYNSRSQLACASQNTLA